MHVEARNAYKCRNYLMLIGLVKHILLNKQAVFRFPGILVAITYPWIIIESVNARGKLSFNFFSRRQQVERPLK